LILKINSIASCQIQILALKLAAFFTLVLGFEFVYFDPRLINKLSISSIWLLVQSILAPIFIFQFGSWFGQF
jgi:hypothetical protein